MLVATGYHIPIVQNKLIAMREKDTKVQFSLTKYLKPHLDSLKL